MGGRVQTGIHLTVDGAERHVVVDTRTTLLDALRERLGVTSPKKGCDHGRAGPHPVQQAFLRHDALQCGYCTPGQVCSAVGMLEEAAAEDVVLDDAEIRERMSGNLCRCGAYVNILAALREMAASEGAG
jgi:xanthine dehydrogenase YagT iron-sulfur-binding subunit